MCHPQKGCPAVLPSRDPSLLALQDPPVIMPVTELNPQSPSGTEHMCVYNSMCEKTQILVILWGFCFIVHIHNFTEGCMGTPLWK